MVETCSRSASPSNPTLPNPNVHSADAFDAEFGPPPAQEATIETLNNSHNNPAPDVQAAFLLFT